MTHIHVSERQPKRGFDGSVLVQQQISQLSTIQGGLTLTVTDAIHNKGWFAKSTDGVSLEVS